MAPLSAPRVAGTVRVPGDKSISHRALIVSALAAGTSRVRGLLLSDDVRSTAGVLRAMGAAIPELGDDVVVTGGPLRAPAGDLDCGNSGTTARLVAGVVAAHDFSARFVGDASLSRRPMRRVAEPLARMGAAFDFEGGGATLPMTVHGAALDDVEWESPVPSAQVKSALLLAGLLAGKQVVVREPQRSRDHTERMLAARGVEVWVNESAVMLLPGQRLAAADVAVPGDPSSAAFLVALAALAGAGELRVADVCVNPTRVGFLLALKGMGADVAVEDERIVGGEPVGTIVARASALRAVAPDPALVPAMIDELPLLAVLAARAEGETTIAGAGELRVKESDRIAAVVAGLRAVGADAEERPDGLVVRGRPGFVPAGRVVTHGDHRIAMAFAVLGLATGGAVEVDDPACVAVSYPTFWDDVARLTAGR